MNSCDLAINKSVESFYRNAPCWSKRKFKLTTVIFLLVLVDVLELHGGRIKAETDHVFNFTVKVSSAQAGFSILGVELNPSFNIEGVLGLQVRIAVAGEQLVQTGCL